MLRTLFIPGADRYEFIDEAQPGRSITCILVHGTFAPGSAWTLPGSPFREAIERGLHDAGGVRFCRFVWRGRWRTGMNNSHADRSNGADALVEHLRTLSRREPGARIVLIGHSHGGCVVLYALQRLGPCPQVAAVATLGTPFFQFYPREMDVILLPVGILLTFILVIPGTVIAVCAVGWFTQSDTWLFLASISGFVLSGLLLWLIQHRVGRLVEPRVRRWSEKTSRITTPRPEAPLFVAYTPWDEAFSWLEFGRRIALFPSYILLGAAGFLGHPLVMILLLATGLGAIVGLAPALGLAGLVLFPLWACLIRVTPVFFGGETLTMLIAGDIVALRDPRIPADPRPCDAAKEFRAEGLFAHSVYTYNAVQRDLVAWVRTVLAPVAVAEGDRAAAQP